MRISGITIPNNKRLRFALTSVYGIGEARADAICKKVKIDSFRKVEELSTEEEALIRGEVETLKLEGDLKREVSGNIKRLKDILSNRGIRHSRRMPVRGQRTKTNSRTVRGNVRKTMGSGKRKVEKT